MNQFPFEFTWLDGPAITRYLDVLRLPGRFCPSDATIRLACHSPSTAARPRQATSSSVARRCRPRSVLAAATSRGWRPSSVSAALRSIPRTGHSQSFRAARHPRWKAHLRSRPRQGRCRRSWASGPTISMAYGRRGDLPCESQVDIVGNAKLRVWATDANGARVAFKIDTTIGNSGSTAVSGTPQQDFAKIFQTQWTVAAFEVVSATRASSGNSSSPIRRGPSTPAAPRRRAMPSPRPARSSPATTRSPT